MAGVMGVVIGDPTSKHFTDIDTKLAQHAASLVILTTAYPGTLVSPAETNGSQTANTTTYGTTEAAMLQTLWDMARAMGLLA